MPFVFGFAPLPALLLEDVALGCRARFEDQQVNMRKNGIGWRRKRGWNGGTNLDSMVRREIGGERGAGGGKK